jgi:hypothetical protein
MRSKTVRWFGMSAALLLGVLLGVACKDGGTSSPGGGGGSCPGSVPRSGSSCPRGEGAFCTYEGGGHKHLCACGSNGKWGCASK